MLQKNTENFWKDKVSKKGCEQKVERHWKGMGSIKQRKLKIYGHYIGMVEDGEDQQ